MKNNEKYQSKKKKVQMNGKGVPPPDRVQDWRAGVNGVVQLFIYLYTVAFFAIFSYVFFSQFYDFYTFFHKKQYLFVTSK